MDLIRGNGGQMEPIGSPFGRKILLPYEIQICEALGIEADEYFEYFDLLQQTKQERNAAFDHIPNVVNEPVSTTAIILAVVGTALSAASALLAPKPRAPEQQRRGENLQGDSIRGRTKYAPLRQFDSVQELATLGSVIPLVYTNKEYDEKVGGVRVESQLLWSQIRNKQTYQLIKVLLLFSCGEIERRPAFSSYAFGSQKIQTYGASRLNMSFAYGGWRQGALVRNPGNDSKGRPVDYTQATYEDLEAQREYFVIQNQYEEKDREEDDWYMDFCGTQTPSTSAQFGQYGPISNGTGWRYPFEFPGKGDGEDEDTKLKIFATRRKHAATFFRLMTTIEWKSNRRFIFTIGSASQQIGFISDFDVDPDIRQNVFYENERSGGSSSQPIVYTQERKYEWETEAKAAGGYDSALTAADENRQFADSSISVGDTFLLGDLVVTCTGVDSDSIWEKDNRFPKKYTLEADDSYTRYSLFEDSEREDHIHTDYQWKGKRPIYRTDYAFPAAKSIYWSGIYKSRS